MNRPPCSSSLAYRHTRPATARTKREVDVLGLQVADQVWRAYCPAKLWSQSKILLCVELTCVRP
eukprot:5745031-Pleurochrysis_carterae.AAC.1